MWLSWLRICLQCSRPGFDPWVEKVPWRRERLPTPVFWPGEFHGLYSPWGRKESDTIEQISLHTNKEARKFGTAQADHRASGREGISNSMPYASKLSHSMDVGSCSPQTHPLLCLHLEDPDSIIEQPCAPHTPGDADSPRIPCSWDSQGQGRRGSRQEGLVLLGTSSLYWKEGNRLISPFSSCLTWVLEPGKKEAFFL